MPSPRRSRRGVTLLELVVVVAITGLLLGLLLGAVQSARLSAARMTAMNTARQLLLATHNYADGHADQMPNVDGEGPGWGRTVIQSLCPSMEADPDGLPPAFLRLKSDPSRGTDPSGVAPFPPIPPPGFTAQPTPDQACSFAFNPLAYAVGARLATVAPDGLSTTVALTEHYGVCGPSEFAWCFRSAVCIGTNGKPSPCVGERSHRTTFADGVMFDDVWPVTTVSRGVPTTVGSLPLTFQVRPSLAQCDPRVPQSSLPGGLLVGRLDGSAHFVRAGVEPAAF